MTGLQYLASRVAELELAVAQLLDQKEAEKKRADEAEAKVAAWSDGPVS